MLGYVDCPACSDKDHACSSCQGKNPEYPNLGASVAKSRAAAGRDRSKLAEHGEKVLEAIRSLQRQALARELPSFKSTSASGTYHNTGKAILQAVANQHASAMQAAINADRRRRADSEICEQYAATMEAKRKAEAQGVIDRQRAAESVSETMGKLEQLLRMFDAPAMALAA